MSQLINTISIATALGVTGYFIYKVILPNIKDIKLPSLQPPNISFLQPPAPAAAPETPTPPAVEPEEPAAESIPEDKEEPKPMVDPPATKSTNTIPTPTQQQGGAGTTAIEGGIKLAYKTTGRKVALPTKASPHENGDRYSAQHKFINYIIFAYLKGNQGAVGCKTDGPNHGKCQSMKPTCLWIDPDLQMSNGSVKYGAEYPHGAKAHSHPCPSCKSAGVSLANKWFGYQCIAYQGPGGPSDRWNEVWVDVGAGPNGEPGNKWVNLLKENYTKNLPADWQRPQGLPINCTNCGSGVGLEAEIRMRGGSGTSIKYGAVYEIIPPTASASQQRINYYYPYMYNSFYNRRRL